MGRDTPLCGDSRWPHGLDYPLHSASVSVRITHDENDSPHAPQPTNEGQIVSKDVPLNTSQVTSEGQTVSKNNSLNPPQLTDDAQTLRIFIIQWLQHRGVPTNDKPIHEVAWAGQDLARPH